jgi:hypothetical protein
MPLQPHRLLSFCLISSEAILLTGVEVRSMMPITLDLKDYRDIIFELNKILKSEKSD